ncbi:MAG: leucine--tRNA ligase [Nitrososphaerota archaeon]
MVVMISTPVKYEEKWLKIWQEKRIFEADPDKSRPKYFITFPYSYQNGPLHVGHGFTASRVDVIARYKRMKGYNVLFPWAWHWTGEAVAGTSERLKRGDQSIIRMLREIDGVPEEILDKFTDPAFICEYYTRENRDVVRAMGFSVDWRREFYTTDLHPYYSKFIEWQYRVLEKKGRVRKGSHPVVWCPVCQSPTGDHDRLIGEGVSPEEFVLVYFKIDDAYLAAATFRPETIFGATNIWINPDAVYTFIRTKDKRLIVSREAANKLREQLLDIEVNGEVIGRELLGKIAYTPLTNKPLPILPAKFVNPSLGTGVVYSVPSHAPYDYAGLKELKQRPEILKQYGIDYSIVKELEPISIINTEGLSPHPAVDLVEKAGIIDSLDPRLEELTKEVYGKEFYSGRMNEKCGEYFGLTVVMARDIVKDRLIREGLGGLMYDLPEKVICRSGDECIVKIVQDQWFLTYSDGDWKEIVKSHLNQMKIYPETARQWFYNVVDWLRDWPCARKTGLGTRLPFDNSWIVETLSDSTIYQALYTISKYLNLGIVSNSQLSIDVLNYVFLGIGNPEKLSISTGIPREILEQMREEFEYWYPVDLRISAKELLPNHLTFFIFHHVAIFTPEKWPRAVGINGMVQVEGEKMSKSKGNFVPLKTAISKYGADATRLALLLSAEEMNDPDWRSKNAEEVRKSLDAFLKTISDYASSRKDDSFTDIDAWLIARLKKWLTDIDSYLEVLKTRSAAATVLYLMSNDWKRYLKRRGGQPGPASKPYIESWIKALSPFAPFTAEEAWSIIGGEGLVSNSSWPEIPEQIPDDILLKEEIIEKVIEDVNEIIEATGKRPSMVNIFVAPRWMRRIVEEVIAAGVQDAASKPRQIIKKLIAEVPSEAKRLPILIEKIASTLRELIPRYGAEVVLKVIDEEFNVYSSARNYIQIEIGCGVEILRAEDAVDDPMGKAMQATPLRPGVYLK